MWWLIVTLAFSLPVIVTYIVCGIYGDKPTTVTGPGRKINSVSPHPSTKRAAPQQKVSKPRKTRKPRVKKVNGKVKITWRSIYEENEDE